MIPSVPTPLPPSCAALVAAEEYERYLSALRAWLASSLHDERPLRAASQAFCTAATAAGCEASCVWKLVAAGAPQPGMRTDLRFIAAMRVLSEAWDAN